MADLFIGKNLLKMQVHRSFSRGDKHSIRARIVSEVSNGFSKSEKNILHAIVLRYETSKPFGIRYTACAMQRSEAIWIAWGHFPWSPQVPSWAATYTRLRSRRKCILQEAKHIEKPAFFLNAVSGTPINFPSLFEQSNYSHTIFFAEIPMQKYRKTPNIYGL